MKPMATCVDMAGMGKGNSFSVKDLLDLPAEGKAGVLPCASPQGQDGSLDLSAGPRGVTGLGGEMGQYLDTAENPYLKWHQSNELLHYGRKYFLYLRKKLPQKIVSLFFFFQNIYSP